MKELKYKIGGLDINRSRLRFYGSDPRYAPHKFVVETDGNTISIYVSHAENDADITARFNLNSKMVGGGSLYINGAGELVLNDFSGKYGAVPREVAERFAGLIIPELEKMGINVSGIYVNPDKFLNPYWEEFGFDSD